MLKYKNYNNMIDQPAASRTVFKNRATERKVKTNYPFYRNAIV